MSTQNSFTTERLSITPLSTDDNYFIMELVNTAGWIQFIGNRNIHSVADADAYIQRIKNNENVIYWTVKLKATGEAAGIVSFIKRDYLEHHDIGFAFLPAFFNKGYAYEAAGAVLNGLVQNNVFTHILATTIPQNISSITLLKKLGLQFDKTIEAEAETLHVYKAAAGELRLGATPNAQA
jgi:[ribosomal protein S5]-alanine N-acetyltransferase